MNFSIIIPTFQNYLYLKLCVESIFKNSKYNHEIIIHLNGHDDKSMNLISENKIIFSQSDQNLGLCTGVNLASKKATKQYILYAHDDMYFLPDWDYHLEKEIKLINHNKFYLSLTQISYTGAVKGNIQHIQFDCGDKIENFNEKKLLDNYEKFKFNDLQGSHWAPHLIHKNVWNKVGGFSEEFNPGMGSDPDLNMKLWKEGIRIFKGLSKFKVYHFGSISLRKKKYLKTNNGTKTFLKKWKITPTFFTRHYLRGGIFLNDKIISNKFFGPLEEPVKSFSYYIGLLKCKVKLFILKLKGT